MICPAHGLMKTSGPLKCLAAENSCRPWLQTPHNKPGACPNKAACPCAHVEAKGGTSTLPISRLEMAAAAALRSERRGAILPHRHRQIDLDDSNEPRAAKRNEKGPRRARHRRHHHHHRHHELLLLHHYRRPSPHSVHELLLDRQRHPCSSPRSERRGCHSATSTSADRARFRGTALLHRLCTANLLGSPSRRAALSVCRGGDVR